jgi:hypothetical protein
MSINLTQGRAAVAEYVCAPRTSRQFLYKEVYDWLEPFSSSREPQERDRDSAGASG